jgi:hypothetical protein
LSSQQSGTPESLLENLPATTIEEVAPAALPADDGVPALDDAEPSLDDSDVPELDMGETVEEEAPAEPEE